MKKETTKVTKILDFHKIDYELFTYAPNQRLSGEEICSILHEDPNKVYKTLLTISKNKKHYVFVLPVNKTLDLKKCAKLKNEKSIDMAHEKEMKPITGYVHGGCSMIGQLKPNIDITVDSSFLKNDYVYISAGEVGKQVKLNPNDISKIIKFSEGDITTSND